MKVKVMKVMMKLEVNKKMGGANKKHDLGQRAKHLDDDHDTLKVKTVTHSVKVNIQKGRQAKNWTQKDLATQIGERVTVVAEYESGKAVPDERVLNRMEKALNMHLRGVKAGQALGVKAPAPKKA